MSHDVEERSWLGTALECEPAFLQIEFSQERPVRSVLRPRRGGAYENQNQVEQYFVALAIDHCVSPIILCGPLRISAPSALNRPLTQRTQRYAEGRRVFPIA